MHLCFLILGAAMGLYALNAADFSYTFFAQGGSGIAITNYIGSAKVVVVPVEIDGQTVKAIEDRAFSGKDIIAVTIPNTIVVIGDYAFENCSNLTTVTIMGSSYVDSF